MVEFQRQGDEALFGDIFWKRPTTKSRAGRLLVIGGHKSEFSQVQAAYQGAGSAGIGECVIAVPDTLRKFLGEADFARYFAATVSGSLARDSLGELLYLAEDYDGCLIGPNISNNSETGILAESLVSKLEQKLIVTDEIIEVLKFNPQLITGNPRMLVVTNMTGLFKLANHLKMPIVIKPNSGLMGKLEIIKQVADISRASYVVADQDIVVVSGGKISLTPLNSSFSDLNPFVAGVMGAFWIQQGKGYEGLTAAAYVLSRVSGELSVTALSREIPKLLADLEDSRF